MDTLGALRLGQDAEGELPSRLHGEKEVARSARYVEAGDLGSSAKFRVADAEGEPAQVWERLRRATRRSSTIPSASEAVQAEVDCC